MGLLTMNDAARSAGRPDGGDAVARPSTRSAGQRASLAMFVGLTFAITWLLWIPGVVVFGDRLSAASPFQVPGFVVLQTLGAAGPSIAAWIVLRRSEGRQAIRRIGDRYRRWRVGLRWYVVAALLVPAMQLGVLAGDALIGDDAVVSAASPLGQMLGDLGVAGLLAVFPLILLSNVFSSPLLEEFGWRGFALPRLQRRYSALTSSVLLGVVWGVWHLPLMRLRRRARPAGARDRGGHDPDDVGVQSHRRQHDRDAAVPCVAQRVGRTAVRRRHPVGGGTADGRGRRAGRPALWSRQSLRPPTLPHDVTLNIRTERTMTRSTETFAPRRHLAVSLRRILVHAVPAVTDRRGAEADGGTDHGTGARYNSAIVRPASSIAMS